MEIGCAVGVLRTGPAAGRLADVRKLGFGYIEPQFGDDAKDADDDAFIRATTNELAHIGLQVWSVHVPFGKEYDLSSQDRGVRERGIASSIRAARGCAALGGQVIVVHCGDAFPDGGDRAKALRRATRSVERIVGGCECLDVRVALENLPPGYLTSSAEELLSVVRQFPENLVGVCIDTGHAYIAGDATGILEAVADRIVTTHLHDNDGSGDQHYVPGFGTINWDAVNRALSRSRYEGPLMFEVSGPGSHAEALVRLAEVGAGMARAIDGPKV